MSKIRLICGEFGPFESMERVQVPLWLAITLKRENKCRIVMPDWMRLSRVLEKDKEMELSNESRLSDLPEHYIEISRLLLENCEDDIEDAKEVRSTIDAIIKVRENCLNEFRGRVIDYVSSAVQQNRNQETYDEFVRRPFYNVPFSAYLPSRRIASSRTSSRCWRSSTSSRIFVVRCFRALSLFVPTNTP
ncbi:uncharacterized protein [Blastocystis hominis]|uniref:Uncharacterized protein n=1 Tax=Blastocystis hominis TaxID=12968 RepID=D8M2C3_BLAHO|nr:uncharacterized protein [Blastocystis hominis]CBK22218.2 unnamed protein product [Blastocystis hominis]|eukprot:XP_012896266.1 uncharacterized protein [Blastocystis hominis]